MFKWLLIAFVWVLMSANSEKVPRKFRGNYEATLVEMTLGTGIEQIQVVQSRAELVVAKTSLTLIMEGKRFSSPLLLEAATKLYSSYRVDFPIPLNQSVFRFYKKGRKIEWLCPGLETVVFVRS
jgi:hypothetical protein